jgi:hypothetical protein
MSSLVRFAKSLPSLERATLLRILQSSGHGCLVAEKGDRAFGFFLEDHIEILSEKARQPARAFLFPAEYRGTLKIVCLDCESKEFPFTIKRGAKVPINFFPDYASVTEPGPLPNIGPP